MARLSYSILLLFISLTQGFGQDIDVDVIPENYTSSSLIPQRFVQPLLGAGDTITDISQHPYLVLLRKVSGDGLVGPATIIKPNWAISIALLIKWLGAGASMYAQVGTTDVNTGQGQKYPVKKVVYGNNYVLWGQVDDIALTKFCPGIQISTYPTLPTQGENLVGVTGFIIGYTSSLSSQQKYGNMVVDDDANCPSQVSSGTFNYPQYNFCNVLGSTQGVICDLQDNGAPFISDTGKLLGLAQVSYVCSFSKSMTFTDVSYYADWITQHTGP